MSQRTEILDLSTLSLSPGEGRRFELGVVIVPLVLAGLQYVIAPQPIPVVLDVTAMTSHGYAVRLRFAATLVGPCMRCLLEAGPRVAVDAREVDQPQSGEELDSPYVDGQLLDLAAWTRDALALHAPVRVLCRDDCLGLCAQCAANLNDAGPDHHHDDAPDPRWAKLRELRLD